MADPTPRPSALKCALGMSFMMCFPGVVLLLAGDARWVEGWLFFVWFVSLCAGCMAWLYMHDPALLEERYRRSGTGGQQRWDTYLVRLLGIIFLSFLVVMALDKRWMWTPVRAPVGVEVFGGASLIGAAFLLFRACTDNTFLSPLVRHQSERAHHVVSGGVYGFVRHPMYLGALLLFLGAPLLLGSLYGLGVGVVGIGVLGVRILGEERMLVQRLAGYSDYQRKVRFRLIPRVW